MIGPSQRLYRIAQPFDGRLAVARRPRGDHELEDEVAAWRAAGLDIVVSMLEADEAEDLGLDQESEICQRHGIELVHCPISDHGIPDTPGPVIAVAERVLARLGAGSQVAAHCYAGMGRSPLLVASVLVMSGLSPKEAWHRLEAARGLSLPDTQAQWQWVADLAGGLHGWPRG